MDLIQLLLLFATLYYMHLRGWIFSMSANVFEDAMINPKKVLELVWDYYELSKSTDNEL